jgi:hypothetical protein
VHEPCINKIHPLDDSLHEERKQMTQQVYHEEEPHPSCFVILLLPRIYACCFLFLCLKSRNGTVVSCTSQHLVFLCSLRWGSLGLKSCIPGIRLYAEQHVICTRFTITRASNRLYIIFKNGECVQYWVDYVRI